MSQMEKHLHRQEQRVLSTVGGKLDPVVTGLSLTVLFLAAVAGVTGWLGGHRTDHRTH